MTDETQPQASQAIDDYPLEPVCGDSFDPDELPQCIPEGLVRQASANYVNERASWVLVPVRFLQAKDVVQVPAMEVVPDGDLRAQMQGDPLRELTIRKIEPLHQALKLTRGQVGAEARFLIIATDGTRLLERGDQHLPARRPKGFKFAAEGLCPENA